MQYILLNDSINGIILADYIRLDAKIRVGLTDEMMRTFNCVHPPLFAQLLRVRWIEYSMMN